MRVLSSLFSVKFNPPRGACNNRFSTPFLTIFSTFPTRLLIILALRIAAPGIKRKKRTMTGTAVVVQDVGTKGAIEGRTTFAAYNSGAGLAKPGPMPV